MISEVSTSGVLYFAPRLGTRAPHAESRELKIRKDRSRDLRIETLGHGCGHHLVGAAGGIQGGGGFH